MRGKKIDGKIVYAPIDAVYNGTKYIHAPDEILALLGWKLIVDTPMPTDSPKYKHYESDYEDGETLTQVWTLVDDTPAMICATLRNWFDDKYRTWNEMLTRWTAIGVQKTITDELRGKEYASLGDLYAEAEIVRKEIEDMENEVVTGE